MKRASLLLWSLMGCFSAVWAGDFSVKNNGDDFQVLYKGTVVENVRFVNMEYAGKNVGGGLIAATVGRMGEGDPARMENVYIQGKVTTAGAKHGLFNVRTNTGNTVVMKNCIVDIVFVEPAETSYILGASEGEIKASLTGVYVKSNATQFTATDLLLITPATVSISIMA